MELNNTEESGYKESRGTSRPRTGSLKELRPQGKVGDHQMVLFYFPPLDGLIRCRFSFRLCFKVMVSLLCGQICAQWLYICGEWLWQSSC